MRIYVVCDLEGVAGVVDHRQQCSWDLSREWFGHFYPQARRLATLELNALVEGVLASGATEVVAWDGHGDFPGGLDVELLHPECKLVMGAGAGGPEGLDAGFDALYQCGLHAMAGTARAVLAHSFGGAIRDYRVNGTSVGEIWMNAYLAGLHGVPFVFLSGDRAAAQEAEALVPEVETAIVKEGLADEARGLAVAPTRSLAPVKARELVREAAHRATAKIDRIAPFRMEPPFTLRVEVTEPAFAERLARRPGVERSSETAVELEGAANPWELLG